MGRTWFGWKSDIERRYEAEKAGLRRTRRTTQHPTGRVVWTLEGDLSSKPLTFTLAFRCLPVFLYRFGMGRPWPLCVESGRSRKPDLILRQKSLRGVNNAVLQQ